MIYITIDFISGLLQTANRRGLRTLMVKALRLWRRESLPGVARALVKIMRDYPYVTYRNWLCDYGTLRKEDRSVIRRHVNTFAHRPRLQRIHGRPRHAYRLRCLRWRLAR